MYDYTTTDLNMPSTSSLSTSLLLRSKSYDTKLNLNSDAPVYIGYENSYSPLVQKTYTNHKTDDEHTKITVTSFAPLPNENRLRQNQAQSAQVRPSSYKIADSKKILDNNSTQSNQDNLKNDGQETNSNRSLSLMWPNGKSNLPIISFCPKVLRKTYWECKKIGEQYRLTFKFFHGDRKLVRAVLEGHGFREVHPNSSEFNIIWSGSNLKSYTFRSLQENQKVNHFPRSCELTRKDRLYKNIQRMQKEKGQKAFNIVPTTFILPYEIDDFYSTFYKEKGIWIVKPVCLSRGRGIYLISHPDQIPLDDNLVVSKYLANPLLIEGFKFDLRMYVAVTSFDPLVFYLYEEGLTRFATIKYDQNVRNIRNTCMHLTNYSLNKKNEKYVKCNDPDVENYGNKWSMSALLRYLSAQGKDTFTLMMNIEEVLIKSLLSVESPLASAARMFMPFRGNCFELFGFDILIDEFFKPWVLEVNLSPSLDCDALLDVRIKSTMISDLFTLTGVHCQNPNTYSNRSRQREQFKTKNHQTRVRPHSANMTSNSQKTPSGHHKAVDPLYDGLSQADQTILKTVVDENSRANGWIRLFPTSDSWEFYSQYLEVRSTTHNMMLHKKLFPRRWQSGNSPKKATQPRAKALQNLNDLYKTNQYNSVETTGASLYEALDRYKKYERKLKDSVRPNEETLRKLSNVPFIQTQTNSSQSLNKSNFSLFPNGNGNGDKQRQRNKDTSLSSEMNEEDSVYSSVADINKPSKSNGKSGSYNSNENKKHLPLLNNNRNGSAYSYKSHLKQDDSGYLSKKSSKNKIKDDYDEVVDNQSEYDEANNEENESDRDDSTSIEKQICTNNNEEVKYDLSTVLSYLDKGYYLSRIQVRNAFALYLFKIKVRLIAESKAKDDSNLNQMDLVIRFIKKAAPNLTQEFKVYVPSKRLPLSEQKRMLAKQLHDFLHIYRKDTEQIRIEIINQLEVERKKYRHKLIEDKAFQTLLYKCTEVDLEEIMSAYMKNSHDSSVFLGVSKHANNSSEIINFNLNQLNKNHETSSPISTNNVQSVYTSQTSVPSSNHENRNFKLSSKIDNRKIRHSQKSKRKQTSTGDDLTQLSDDSLFGHSSNSGSEHESLLHSASNKKHAYSTSGKEKGLAKPKTNEVSSRYKQTSSRLSHIGSSGIRDKKEIVATKKIDNQTLMSNIYLNSNKKTQSTKLKSSSNTNLISSNLSRLTPLISSQHQLNYDDEQSMLSNGLKSLHIKQHDRIYSAAKSAFKITSNLDDSNTFNHKNGFNSINQVEDGQQQDRDRANDAKRSNEKQSSSLLLIEKLERQKEKTNKLLAKSKAKHNEMISTIVNSYSIANNNNNNNSSKTNSNTTTSNSFISPIAN